MCDIRHISNLYQYETWQICSQIWIINITLKEFLGVINNLGDVILDEAALVKASVDAVGEQKTAHDEDEDSTEDQEEIFMEIEFIFCVNN